MSISSITASNAYAALTPPADATTRPGSFKNLAKSLESGDLAGAQTAFAALQQNAPPAIGTSTSTSTGQASPFADDISAIGKALTAGDLAGAQTAFAKLRDDGQAAQAAKGGEGTHAAGGHHHGHHGAKPAAAADAASTSSTSSTNTGAAAASATTATGTTIGSTISVKV